MSDTIAISQDLEVNDVTGMPADSLVSRLWVAAVRAHTVTEFQDAFPGQEGDVIAALKGLRKCGLVSRNIGGRFFHAQSEGILDAKEAEVYSRTEEDILETAPPPMIRARKTRARLRTRSFVKHEATVQNIVLDYALEHSPVSYSKVSAHFPDEAPPSLRHAIFTLHQRGLLVRVSHGVYRHRDWVPPKKEAAPRISVKKSRPKRATTRSPNSPVVAQQAPQKTTRTPSRRSPNPIRTLPESNSAVRALPPRARQESAPIRKQHAVLRAVPTAGITTCTHLASVVPMGLPEIRQAILSLEARGRVHTAEFGKELLVEMTDATRQMTPIMPGRFAERLDLSDNRKAQLLRTLHLLQPVSPSTMEKVARQCLKGITGYNLGRILHSLGEDGHITAMTMRDGAGIALTAKGCKAAKLLSRHVEIPDPSTLRRAASGAPAERTAAIVAPTLVRPCEEDFYHLPPFFELWGLHTLSAAIEESLGREQDHSDRSQPLPDDLAQQLQMYDALQAHGSRRPRRAKVSVWEGQYQV